MIKRYAICYSVALLIFLFFLTLTAHSFYGDADHNHTNITIGVAGQNANQVTSLMGIAPLKAINGWAGAYVSRQVADEMVTSEVLNGHLQGSIAIGDVDIEAYTTATRDKWRGIDLAIETGYFIRPGQTTITSITFSGGAGNYTERRTEDEEIGRDANDAQTTFGWLAFVSARYKNISAVVRFKPEIGFDHVTTEASVAFNQDLTSNLAFNATLQAISDGQAVTEDSVHTQYLIGITYTPE